MSPVIIGVDPHKRSHSAVVLDDREEIVAQVWVTASKRQVDQLLAWALAAEQIWAVENVNAWGGCWPSSWSAAARWSSTCLACRRAPSAAT